MLRIERGRVGEIGGEGREGGKKRRVGEGGRKETHRRERGKKRQRLREAARLLYPGEEIPLSLCFTLESAAGKPGFPMFFCVVPTLHSVVGDEYGGLVS